MNNNLIIIYIINNGDVFFSFLTINPYRSNDNSTHFEIDF